MEKRTSIKMSKKLICISTSIFILLLIATTQYHPQLLQPDTISGQYQTEQPYNTSATIDDLLIAQRKQILLEMENFEYPNGKFGIDAEKLEDLTIETFGQPVRSIIITTWRSGSTFLGDILNSIPGNYYHYEPLLNYEIKRIRDKPESDDAIDNLKNLLYCNYRNMQNYLEYGESHKHLFEHNIRLWNVCKSYPHYCWKSRFLTPFCKLFPFQSMKVVRLSLAVAEKLLEDKSLNVRLILLIRDPRGTMQSRRHRKWCPGNPDCYYTPNLCKDLVSDYETAEILLKKYPSRFRTLRYEDFSVNVYEMSQEILQFYGLPFDPKVEEFLDTHTKYNRGGVSSTFRDSKTAPFHWITDLTWEEVDDIQSSCTKAMKLWGYKKVKDLEDLESKDTIILPPPFT